MAQETDREAMSAFIRSRVPGSRSAMADFMADGVAWSHWRWRARELVGKDNVMTNYFEPLVRSFPDLDFRILDAVFGDHNLAIRGEFRGTFAEDWGSTPAHGRPVAWFAHDIYEFRDGKIVRAWYGNDTLTVARQLGALPDDGRTIGHDPFQEPS
jgi:predicted ester cyclase